MTDKNPHKEALGRKLTAEQYRITQESETERAFSGIYCDHHEKGAYRCVCCNADLFSSDTKYDSGSGWPSFWVPMAEDRVKVITDVSHGMRREEVRCASCDAHLGHVFPDGPKPTGLRYCINSGSLDFESSDQSDQDK